MWWALDKIQTQSCLVLSCSQRYPKESHLWHTDTEHSPPPSAVLSPAGSQEAQLREWEKAMLVLWSVLVLLHLVL